MAEQITAIGQLNNAAAEDGRPPGTSGSAQSLVVGERPDDFQTIPDQCAHLWRAGGKFVRVKEIDVKSPVAFGG